MSREYEEKSDAFRVAFRKFHIGPPREYPSNKRRAAYRIGRNESFNILMVRFLPQPGNDDSYSECDAVGRWPARRDIASLQSCGRLHLSCLHLQRRIPSIWPAYSALCNSTSPSLLYMCMLCSIYSENMAKLSPDKRCRPVNEVTDGLGSACVVIEVNHGSRKASAAVGLLDGSGCNRRFVNLTIFGDN
ncbi:hypothetical protein T265_03094 [Opisthorchis viverrini]|uniref:Uncharacterized protein n=1 Tax=Opisthorchis viverrini TaxID=6198 RepID=A0A075A4G8_OPIVI|nr:hypothetical protein T265_03094 [Opisthorchis viverrini]KER30485.1 hypothetical protein T265_03094 [Opisthorchis viverrini]